MVHAIDPNPQEVEAGGSLNLRLLNYLVNSRTVRTVIERLVSNKQTKSKIRVSKIDYHIKAPFTKPDSI